MVVASFKNIVVCSDFSANSNKAFEVAAGLAEGGKVTVLHVVATTYNYDDPQAAAAAGVAKIYGERAQKHLQRLYGAKGVAEIAIEYGNEAEKIIGYARQKDADLIVIGARGVGFVAGILGGGSVADKVIRNSPIPVLVVPALRG